MKELQELEQHVTEANMLLSQKNWLKIIPADQYVDAHSRMVEVRTRLLDSAFHSNDVLDAFKNLINEVVDNINVLSKSRNKDGVEYSTADLLKLRLSALRLVAEPAVVSDVEKYIQMAMDEQRQTIAQLMYTNNQLKSAIRNQGTQQ